MIDARFYEQEQRSYGESDFKARGKMRNCDRLGQIVGTLSGGFVWHYEPVSGETVCRALRPNYVFWPRNIPVDPGVGGLLKARGFWRLDFTVEILAPKLFGGLPLTVQVFDATDNLADSASTDPYDETPFRSPNPNDWQFMNFLFNDSGDSLVARPPGPGDFIVGTDIALGLRGTYEAPGSVGTHTRQLFLRHSLEGFCHPAFGLMTQRAHWSPGNFGHYLTHYYDRQFAGDIFADKPVMSADQPDIPVCNLTITFRRIFDFAPRILANQTRYGTTGVDGGIYRFTFSENGFNDGNGKVNAQWDFGDGFTGGPGFIVSHDYFNNTQRTVSVIVTDSNGFTNSGSRVVTPKRVDFTFTNIGGSVWQFTNLSTAGDSSISSYLWTFSAINPGTSTLANPTFDFQDTGPLQRSASLRVNWADGTSYQTPDRPVV